MTLTLTPEQQKTLVQICRAASEFYRNEEDSFRQLADECDGDPAMQSDMNVRGNAFAAKAEKAFSMSLLIAQGE
jgi:hypothetical protein